MRILFFKNRLFILLFQLISYFLLEQFFEAFLFGSSDQRSSSSDTGTHTSSYNTVALQFAPKHLGLVLVC